MANQQRDLRSRQDSTSMESRSWNSPARNGYEHNNKRCRKVFECDVVSCSSVAPFSGHLWHSMGDYASYQPDDCTPLGDEAYKRIRTNYFYQHRNVDALSSLENTPDGPRWRRTCSTPGRRSLGYCPSVPAARGWHSNDYGANAVIAARPWSCAEDFHTPIDYLDPDFRDAIPDAACNRVPDWPGGSCQGGSHQHAYGYWDRGGPIHIPQQTVGRFSSQNHQQLRSDMTTSRPGIPEYPSVYLEATTWRDNRVTAIWAQQSTASTCDENLTPSPSACWPAMYRGSTYQCPSPFSCSEGFNPWDPRFSAHAQIHMHDACLRQLEEWSTALRVHSPEGIALTMHLWQRIEARALACQCCSLIASLATALWLSMKVLSGRRTVPSAARLERVVGLPSGTLKRMELVLMEWLDWDPLLDFFPSCD